MCHREEADQWYAQKPRVVALIRDMGNAIENLKKTESTKEAQVIADNTGKTHEEKKESLEKIMKGFLEGWPG